MLPNSEYYGVTMSSVSSQIRESFHGKKIMTMQRGRDEIDVKIGYDDKNRSSIA